MSRKHTIRFILAALVIMIFFIVQTGQPAPLPATQPISQQTTIATSSSILGVMTKTADCVTNGTLPDDRCTPGAIDPAVTEDNIHTTICISGYTKTVRPEVSVTNKIKTQVMAAYNDSESPKNFELDHLISLELGGCPDCVANLWPESYNITLGAREKDKVENYLHKEVCDGSISLSEAQNEIAKNWKSVYMQLNPGATGN